MNYIEHHLLNMYVTTTYLLRLRKHQYLKYSIVGRNHRRDVNHLPEAESRTQGFEAKAKDLRLRGQG